MIWVILAVSMLACLLNNVIKKSSGDRFVNKAVMFHFYNAVVSLVSAVSLLVISGGFRVSLFSVVLGVGFGLITATNYMFSLKSYQTGPFSYTSVIISLSTIIPALSGYFIWNEEISVLKAVGIVLMLICFLCSVDFSGKQNKTSWLWLGYAFLTFVSTGCIGVMQKWHQSSPYKGELDGFLIIAFTVSFVFSISAAAFRYKGCDREERQTAKKDVTVIAVVLMAVGGMCAAANNKMNLYLSGVMDSAVFFPVVNGGGLILSTITSIILFKERFNLQKWIGIIIGIVSVVLLCS